MRRDSLIDAIKRCKGFGDAGGEAGNLKTLPFSTMSAAMTQAAEP